MKRGYYKKFSFLCVALILLSATVLVQTALAYETVQDTGFFANPQRGTIQTFDNADPETAYLQINPTFSSNTDTITFKTYESEEIPTRLNSFPSVYRFFSFEPSNENAIQKMEIVFTVVRNNNLDLTPANVALYGYTTEKEWEKIGHSIAYTTNNQYVFKAEASDMFQFVISSSNALPPAIPVEKNTTVTTRPTQNPQDEITQNRTTQTASESSAQRVYVEENDGPNWFLVVLIFLILVGGIGGTVSFVIAKHKIGPTTIQKVENVTLPQDVAKAISQNKTNGQIVDELTDKDHSLKDIMAELKKHGRVR